MPKSRIIKEIAESTASIEMSLNRVYLLASDVDNEEIMKWAEKELQGYGNDDELPSYRTCRNYSVQYSGINGMMNVKNAILQPCYFKKETIEKITHIRIRDSIRSIEEKVNTKEDIRIDLGLYVGEVYECSGQMIKCTNISQLLPAFLLQDILSNVKQKIIRELIAFEKEYGCLDELEIQNDSDPENRAFWNNVTVRIQQESKKLYMQGFYSDAAERAIREVETKMREMFRKLKPAAKEPEKIGDIIGALLSANGVYQYCDNTTQDGKNFQEGFVRLVSGFFTAYRNPMAHRNKNLSKQEAFELITLSSMIMNVLSEGS